MNRTPLTTPPWELVWLTLLLAAYLLSDALFGQAGYEFMNHVGPVWLATVLSLGALRMARMDAGSIWTPLFWFRASTAAYYGFGSLVPLFADPARRAYMQAFFRFYSEDMAKANIIFVVAVIVVLLASNAWLSAFGQGRADPRAHKRGGGAMLAAGLLFLAVGATVKYVLVLPYAFGITDFVLPGSVATLGKFTFAAIFLLTAWSRAHARSLLPLMAAFAVLDMLAGAVSFNKSEVLGALIMFLLAFIWPRMTPLRLAVAASLVVLTYVALVPIVNFGRSELFQRYGTLGEAELSERVEILSRAIGTAHTDPAASRGMSRLSYTNQATFAVHEYDSLRPGESYVNILAVFVPRVFWPDKPIITQVANDFNAAATGNPNSASSPGLFAEAYWNFGWVGVILVMATLGAILAGLSRYALSVVQAGLWFYFPVVLLAMRIGFRTDGYFVVDVAGATVLAVALHLLLTPIAMALAPAARRGGRPQMRPLSAPART
jgi:hypothetical protein